jgi:serine/threonine protein kinase
VDRQYQAQLADFGLSQIGDTSTSGMSNTNTGAGTVRWKPPEQFKEDIRRTMSGDIWAFGCLGVVVSILHLYNGCLLTLS